MHTHTQFFCRPVDFSGRAVGYKRGVVSRVTSRRPRERDAAARVKFARLADQTRRVDLVGGFVLVLGYSLDDDDDDDVFLEFVLSFRVQVSPDATRARPRRV